MKPIAQHPLAAAPERALNAEELTRLQELLKRCPPATFEAACRFFKTHDVAYLTPLIAGVVERYVERERRPRLASPSDDLRLVEDLGIDSLTMMEIVVLAEDVLYISVSNDELIHLRTFGEIRRFLAMKVVAR